MACYQMGERQFETYVMSTVITLNTYLQGLYIYNEHNLYIGDVKVSPEGRCLELLQWT